MRVLSLFSGIGGLELGLERAGMSIAGQCEIDPFCRLVLEKHWPGCPRWTDVKEINGSSVAEKCGAIDLVCGGFPCQDISVAGKGIGLSGERSGLWWEMRRVISEVRPSWVLAENVPALRTRGGDDVLSALEGLGYACWPLVVGAWAVGAPHKRDRVWIVAYSDGERWQAQGDRRVQEHTDAGVHGEEGNDGRLAKANGNTLRLERQRAGGDRPTPPVATGPVLADAIDADGVCGMHESQRRQDRGTPTRWPSRPGQPQYEWEEARLVESAVGGAANGPARRLSRWRRSALRALGNAVVTQVSEAIGRLIMELHVDTRNHDRVLASA